MKLLRTSAFPLLFLLGGLVLGFGVSTMQRGVEPSSIFSSADAERELREGSLEYRFINPLLACGEFENVSNQEIGALKKDMVSYMDNAIADAKATQISVYFRDLNNGPWLGLSEKEKFSPGSLLKVPFMIALYKVAENDPDFLSRQIQYTGGHADFSEYFRPERVLEENQIYTVEELIRRMIVYSDNDATLLLAELVPRDTIERTYRDLGIETPKNSEYVMTVRTYASFFRILYNGTYLSKTFSEKALALLSETTFAKGLRSVIPSHVVVSSKFGEREDGGINNKQLHDCGIVYHPDHPYLLCVMARGNDVSALATAIASVSSLVYTSINSSEK